MASLSRKTAHFPQALILLYHRIHTLNADPQLLCVSANHFQQQLEILRQDYQPISLVELAKCVANGAIPDRAVAITFDDGYLDNLQIAKPILEESCIPATVFVTARGKDCTREFWWDELERILLHHRPLPAALTLSIDYHRHEWRFEAINQSQHDPAWNVLEPSPATERQSLYLFLGNLLRPLGDAHRSDLLHRLADWAGDTGKARATHRAMNDDQLRELVQSGLMSVGAHTITHSILALQSPDEQCAEIAGSRHRLQSILNQEVETFSYPFGTPRDYSARTLAIVRECGFAAACANQGRVAGSRCLTSLDSDVFALPRMVVPDCPGDEFTQWLDACWSSPTPRRGKRVAAGT